MSRTKLDDIFHDQGIMKVYEAEGQAFYDTCTVFDRHNFARDVKRTLDTDDYAQDEKGGKYYISAFGVLRLAAVMRNHVLLDAIMAPLLIPTSPIMAPILPPVPALPSPQSVLGAFTPGSFQQPNYYMQPQYPLFYHQQAVPGTNWTFHNE